MTTPRLSLPSLPTGLPYPQGRASQRGEAVEWISMQDPALLAAMTHEERLEVLRILLPDVFESKPGRPQPMADPLLHSAIEAILQSVPYPADAAHRDYDIAEDFFHQYRALRTSGALDTAMLQAHLGDTGPFIRQVAVLAMRSMGLVPGLMEVRTRETSLKNFNSPLENGGDFMGLAHVRSELNDDSKMLQVFITVNEDHPFLKTLHPDNADAFIELAGAVLHELSHVEETVALLHRESIDTILREDWMLTQRHVVGEYGNCYDIYRSLLSERQAYHRQHLYFALEGATAILPEESYCRGDKNRHHMTEQRMQKMTQTLIALMEKEIAPSGPAAPVDAYRPNF